MSSPCERVPRRAGRAERHRLIEMIDLPYRWLERVEERRRLLTLDARAERDLGVSRADVEREARKAFWRA